MITIKLILQRFNPSGPQKEEVGLSAICPWARKHSKTREERKVLDVNPETLSLCFPDPRSHRVVSVFQRLMQGESVVADPTRGWPDLTQHLPTLASGHAPLSD